MGSATANQTVNAILKKIGGTGAKKGRGGRKLGRYSKHPSSVRYRAERRWESNQVKRVMRHLRRYPGEVQARAFLAARDTREARAFLASLPIPE
jgi:hypothetical protein